MDSIKITDSKISLMINDDESRVISFDPMDIGFVNRYYGLVDFLNSHQQIYADEASIIDKSDCSEEEKTRRGFKLFEKMCNETKEQFDIVFGKGTMNRIFGESLKLNMFNELLYGISPYIQEVRSKKIGKYTAEKTGGVMS